MQFINWKQAYLETAPLRFRQYSWVEKDFAKSHDDNHRSIKKII